MCWKRFLAMTLAVAAGSDSVRMKEAASGAWVAMSSSKRRSEMRVTLPRRRGTRAQESSPVKPVR